MFISSFWSDKITASIKSNEKITIESFPEEILSLFFSYLSRCDDWSLLLVNKRFSRIANEALDPGPGNRCLDLAMKAKDLRMVKQLINDSRIDPAERNNLLIFWASENGYHDIVKELLKNKRVNPTDCNNRALFHAILNDHYAVVEELMKDNRVLMGGGKNALIWASRSGKVEMVKFLLARFGRLFIKDMDTALEEASKNGHLNVVKFLVEEKGVFPSLTAGLKMEIHYYLWDQVTRLITKKNEYVIEHLLRFFNDGIDLSNDVCMMLKRGETRLIKDLNRQLTVLLTLQKADIVGTQYEHYKNEFLADLKSLRVQG